MKTMIIMIFLHIVDDYYLQGILAKMKQRSWWKDLNLSNFYSKDYFVGLAMHAMSWSFMINLPFLFSSNEITYTISFSVNAIIHFYVDDLKANKQKTNLVIDQTIHILQILITCIIMSIFK